MLTLARSLSCQQRRRDRLRRRHAGQLVGNHGAHHPRPAGLAIALDRSQTGQRLDDRIVEALLAVRTRLSDAADRDVDQVRLDGSHDRLTDPQPIDGARAEVLYEDVGCLHESLQ